ncbi:hypothetical protein VE02_04641 [Pseudogymnoascus sp. 03VT05]|nr:hypothetical protein VE02_04641 [Pseudogymnoascus sp. 03VT05]
MNALSIATAVVTLIGAVSKTIQAVKIVYGGPAKLQVMFNEVSDLTAILNNVAAILSQRVSASENIDGLVNIIVSLQKSRAILQSLDQFIHQISPASLTWDIILSRSKSNTIIEHLVGSFGDSRYIEDYRFSHLHEVVLDIKHSTIKEALSRDPSWINCTDTQQNTPLLWASRRGNNAHVQTLLHCGADSSIKNDVGEDALIESVYFGRLDCLLSLLRANAPITEAADGKTILHHACKLRDDLAYIEPIIERGTNINRRDYLSRSPLALASSINHFRTIKYLLDHGADIEARDAYGSTSLMRAVRYGALEAATLLFFYGADITATDIDNLTILHKVALSTDTSMIKLLQAQDLRGLDPDN